MDLKQTSDVQAYVDDFVSISARLPELSDGFKQRCFARGTCLYLRKKFADRTFNTLLDMTHYTMRLTAVVEEHMFAPDAQARPLVAAMHVSSTKSKVTCYRCGKTGHIKKNRKVKLQDDDPQVARKSNKSSAAMKGSAWFREYNGSGRVNAVTGPARGSRPVR